MPVRTDLAMESAAAYRQHPPEGIQFREETLEGIHVTHVEITTDQAASLLGRHLGHYVTVEFSPEKEDAQALAHALAKILQPWLPQTGCILVVGLGNDRMTPDALGPRAVRKILATRHLPPDFAQKTGLEGLRPVAALAPGVLAQTGMESSELVHSVVKDISPSAVIVIDAMAARAYQRLGRTIQLADSGISPGAGVDNARKELSKSTLGVPVISMGIPTVVDGGTLACELCGLKDDSALPPSARQLTVTPRDIDSMIERGAKQLSLGINAALQPHLTLEEIDYLAS